MEARLEEISLPADLPFLETLATSSSTPFPLAKSDADDDLKREMAFYTQALEAVHMSRPIISRLGMPFSRPDDYFAEMIKTDTHMERIRKRMIEEVETIKTSEERKKLRELKKFGKKVQTSVLIARQESKKAEMDKIKSLRRKKTENAKSALSNDDDFDVQVEETLGDEAATPGYGARKREANSKGPNGKPNHKRMGKDAKFGFGGKRKFDKSNTRESTDDHGFSVTNNKKPFSGAGKGKPSTAGGIRKKTGGKPARPGKGRRANIRGKK